MDVLAKHAEELLARRRQIADDIAACESLLAEKVEEYRALNVQISQVVASAQTIKKGMMQ